jgi:hypothetical protein
VLALLANCHRDPRQQGRPFTIADFMPERRKKRIRKSSDDEIDAFLSQYPEK